MATATAHARPTTINDRKAQQMEELRNWKKPKPLDLMLANSGKLSKLQKGIIPGLDALDVTTNWWSWGTINHGDCKMDDAVLYLSSDGTGIFTAYTITTDDGDVWIVEGLGLLDNNGVELYRIPKFDGPRMSFADSYYPVHQNVNYPAYLMPSVTQIRMYHHC
jgi:hypothetical protein